MSIFLFLGVWEKKEKINIPEAFEKVSIEELFSSCDAIALHIHSSKDKGISG